MFFHSTNFTLKEEKMFMRKKALEKWLLTTLPKTSTGSVSFVLRDKCKHEASIYQAKRSSAVNYGVQSRLEDAYTDLGSFPFS